MDNSYSLNELINDINMGREIELHIGNDNYFIQPSYSDPDFGKPNYTPRFVIYSCKHEEIEQELFCGTADEILHCQLSNQKILFKDFQDVIVDCIL